MDDVTLPPNLNVPNAETNWVGVYVVANNVYVAVSYQLTPVIAGTNATSAAGPTSYVDFYRSNDGGNDMVGSIQLWPGTAAVFADPDRRQQEDLFYGQESAVSADLGTGWSNIPSTADSFHSLAFTGGMLLLGGEKGLTPVALDGNTAATLRRYRSDNFSQRISIP